jgi:hypothetical protein
MVPFAAEKILKPRLEGALSTHLLPEGIERSQSTKE